VPTSSSTLGAGQAIITIVKNSMSKNKNLNSNLKKVIKHV